MTKLLLCVSGFGVEGLCMLGLAIVRSGTHAIILLIIGVGVSGFTISGNTSGSSSGNLLPTVLIIFYA